jgi:abnormal spindle-like microcephaly-associated protein
MAFKVLEEYSYGVKYERFPILGYNFAIDCLEDLVNGVQLARIAEIIADNHSFSITKDLNLHPKSTTQRKLNLKNAIAALLAAKVPLSIRDPNELVKGEKESMLRILWEIIVSAEFPSLLDVQELRREIQEISSEEVTLGEVPSREESYRSLLLLWCQVVCKKYDIEIENFSSSFSDGKALCYIVHYYHPELVSPDAIKKTTRDVFPQFEKRVCSFTKLC